MRRTNAVLALLALSLTAQAQSPPDHDRRVVGLRAEPSLALPGTYDVFASFQLARFDGGAGTLDLSLEAQLFEDGAPTPGLIGLGIAFGPSAVCSLDACASQSLCASLSVDGAPLLGACMPMLPHPGDDAPWCGCSGVIEVPVAQQLAVAPGARLELRLAPAPGAAPEPYTADDTWVLELTGDEVVPYCFGDQTFLGCPCFNVGAPGHGCANSVGAGALLDTDGGTSVFADDLVFLGTSMPAGQPALCFAGTNTVNGGLGLPFGDGLRCVGGVVRRIGVQTADAAGEAKWGPGLFAANGWTAGDQRFVQLWYRDPAGPCGTGFNLSNALRVLVTP